TVKAAQASGYSLLYWGSIILGLGNGTVEAFINPVVATMFSKEKTKWLNILHAAWPGGLVIGGIITIFMGSIAAEGDWRLVLGIIAIPAIIYLLLLSTAKFPQSERESAGVTYREMLGEFGAFGALIGFGLIFMQLAEVIPQVAEFKWPFIGACTLIVTIIFGVYTQSLGRGIMAFLIIIMMPLAVTEIGTDGWITGLMEEPMKAAGQNAGWVLVYTSAIMMVLRFFAGPIVHKTSPIGLLLGSCVLAIAGLFALSKCGSAGLGAIFAAATLYGFGKTFFWPTMLGVTAEQCPKGGALTLNAISGIGMIAVGVLGFPFIGYLQESTASSQLAPAVAEQVLNEKEYLGQPYSAIDEAKAKALTDEADKTAVEEANKAGQFDALAKMAGFPTFMLLCYIALFMYFKSKGGYKAEVLTGHGAEDDKFTGGLEGAVEA
ncbi:MAG: MFS transporter, partial [Planctomycetaceae bacterium]|nr:MFS transporter [Planctomycetaceae bacterium]